MTPGAVTAKPAGFDGSSIESLLMTLLFPLMIVSLAFSQSPPIAIGRVIGQIASPLSIAVALATVLVALRTSAWPTGALGLLLFLRGLRFGAPESGRLDLIYTVVGAAVFSAAGALVIARRPGLLQRQFVIFCIISLPIMLLQVIGVGWSQVLRTDIHQVALGFTQVPTLFVLPGQVVHNTLQFRPAGPIYANDVTSMIVAFGLGGYYGGLRRSNLSWSDAVVLGVVVMLMAKITFLVLLFLLWARTRIGPAERRHVWASLGLFLTLLAVYGVLFPGLSAYNLSPVEAWFNFQVRMVDLLVSSGIPFLGRLAHRFPYLVFVKVNPMGNQSGYALALKQIRFLIPGLVLSAAGAWLAVRELRRLDVRQRREVLGVALAAVLVPLSSVALGHFIFWFLAGGALLPFWRAADPGFGGVVSEPVQ
jgi:hypothetical protein